MKKFPLFVAIASLSLFAACNQQATEQTNTSVQASSSSSMSSDEMTVNTNGEVSNAKWQDLQGAYWKFSDCFWEKSCASVLLTSTDGENWRPGSSWQGSNELWYRFGFYTEKTNSAETPWMDVLRVEQSKDGEMWSQKYDSLSWNGRDGTEFAFGPGFSVWIRQPQ